MPFNQQPPALGNQYEDDRVLRSYVERTLPAEILREIEPQGLDLICGDSHDEPPFRKL